MADPRKLAPLALAVLAACCPAGGQFIGTWQIGTDTNAFTCAGVSGSNAITGDITLASGTNGDIVSTDPDGCNLSWTVNGNTLTLVAGQSCGETANGVTSSVNFSSGSVTSTGAATLSGTLAGSGTFNIVACTFSDTFSATKVAN
ncbi:MAG TPA: hypothetical protein VMB50_17855 [Myxococcales bacterium]|nr:hypothetical protein [Myxococcales bacterium]